MKKNDLFKLIKSLESAEIRYFKRVAQFHIEKENNVYIKLFDEIRKQDDYVEQSIKESFKKAGYSSFSKNFSFNKGYLYAMLLKSLRSYRSEKSVHLTINESVSDVEFLMDKGLLDQALDLIQRTKKKAADYQHFFAILELLKLERMIVRRFSLSDTLQRLEAIEEEGRMILKKMEVEANILNEYEKMFVQSRNRTTFPEKSATILDNFWKIVGHEPTMPQFTFDTVVYFHLAKYQINNSQRQFEAAAYHLAFIIKTFESVPHLLVLGQYQERYLNTLNNYFLVQYSLQDRPKGTETLQKMEAFVPANIKVEAAQFHILYFCKMLDLFRATEYAGITKLSKQIEDGLNNFAAYIPKSRVLSFRYNLSVAYYFENKPKEALDWLQQILNDEKQEVRQDIQMFAQVFSILLYVEIGYDTLALHLIKVTIKRIKVTQAKAPLLISLLKAVRKHLRKNDKQALLEVQTELKTSRGLEEMKLWLVNYLRRK